MTKVTMMQPKAKVQKGRHVMLPQARLYMARTLLMLIEARTFTELFESPRDRRWLQALVREYLGLQVDLNKEETYVELADAWERFAVESEQDLKEDKIGRNLDKLRQDIAQSLSMTPVESQLLSLALHALHNSDLHSSLELAGESDDYSTACFFARVLQLEDSEVYEAFKVHNPLRRMPQKDGGINFASPTKLLEFAPHIKELLRRPGVTAGDVLATFFRKSPEPKLAMGDFVGMGDEVQLVRRYLVQVAASERSGVNILLHGKPGTGKTELARALAKDLDLVLQEVPAAEENKTPLPPMRRLMAYCTSQEIMRLRNGTMMLFDEVEDVFPWAESGGLFQSRSRGGGSADRNKGLLTQVLETNPRPAIWISNSIHQIDPAFLRRFDMVLELSGPDRAARQRIVEGLFQGLPIRSQRVASVVARTDYAVAHVERMANVIRAMAPVDEGEGEKMLDVLERQLQNALDLHASDKKTSMLLPYRPECVNTDHDLAEVAEALLELPSARMCLYGSPGTGKTQWAKELANRLDKPLLVRRASDLLDQFVGGTESAIRAAFEEARRDGAVLLIDEADSFLQSRERAKANWEITMVNEMLTGMEQFEGIFIASTNLIDLIDSASARRFDFKVAFSPLTGCQADLLFGDLLERYGLDGAAIPADLQPERLAGSTPGDFANVARQARLSRSMRTIDGLYQAVKKEIAFRAEGAGVKRRMGFV